VHHPFLTAKAPFPTGAHVEAAFAANPPEHDPSAQLDDDKVFLFETVAPSRRVGVSQSEAQREREAERALADALEENRRLELELRASLKREQEARVRAEANDAFKEVFVSILGHDLRNPVNTILTTSRLMTLRGELAPESQKRLDRVISSGVRMQHMIEQILDMARDRLALGIIVAPTGEQDLVPLVSSIIDDVQQARAEGRSEGLGLGLYISERIVAAHGGVLEVHSSEGNGTYFEATFPRFQ
jgi:signal transduction histidine kinase